MRTEQKRDVKKYFFLLPNAVFELGLHVYELAIYAYLLRIEDRRTWQCVVSYPAVADKLGISVNTVAKYVGLLEEHGLITTERTDVFTKDGLKRNGCLRYTILPIQNAIDRFHERQLAELEQAAAQQRARRPAWRLSKRTGSKAHDSPCQPLWAAVWPDDGRGRVPAPPRGFRPVWASCGRRCGTRLPANRGTKGKAG